MYMYIKFGNCIQYLHIVHAEGKTSLQRTSTSYTTGGECEYMQHTLYMYTCIILYMDMLVCFTVDNRYVFGRKIAVCKNT